MATYNAQWINELDETTPAATDPKSEGDNAIREIKDVLNNTFPNVVSSDAFNGTMSDLNDLVDGNTLPKDTVIMWYGTETANPGGGPAGGWTICDGRARPGGGNAPDLRQRFVIGAKSDLDVDPNHVLTPLSGATGGNNETVINSFLGGAIRFTTEGHALTVDELPSHTHELDTVISADNDSGNWAEDAQGTNPVSNAKPTGATGGNQAHTHRFSIDTTGLGTFSNIPAYVALMYIIKD